MTTGALFDVRTHERVIADALYEFLWNATEIHATRTIAGQMADAVRDALTTAGRVITYAGESPEDVQPLVGSRDRKTQRAAAEFAAGVNAGTQGARILSFIAYRGDEGATHDEIEQATGLRYGSYGARCRALARQGWITDSRTVRAGLRTGLEQTVWVATGKGREWFANG